MTVDNDFLVSFVCDARGGTCCSKRMPRFRIIVPPNCLDQPTRICARAARAKSKLKLMEGEAHSSKIVEFSPTRFNGNIALDIPCAVGEHSERDVVVLTSDDLDHWKQANFKRSECSDLDNSRRLILNVLPKFILIYNRHRMVSLNVGPGGGVLPAVDNQTKVQFPPGALTKPTNVMIQSFPVDPEFFPEGFCASPVLTLEPRRRRFHQNVHYFIPAPAIDRSKYHCHVLCSITEGTSESEWKDVTNSVEIIWDDEIAKFSGNVSGRFWLVFIRQDSKAQFSVLKMADEVYRKTIEPRWTVFVSATGSFVDEQCLAVEVSVSSVPVSSLVQTPVTVAEGEQLAFDFASSPPLRFNSHGLEPQYEIFSAHTIKYRLALDDARRPPDAQIPALTCHLKSRPGHPAIPVLLG